MSDSRTYVAERIICTHSREPLIVSRVGFGCSQAMDASRAFEDLGITLSLPDGVSALLVPTQEDPNFIDGAIFFNPPIDGETPFGVRHIWKGCWDPLRETGTDHGEITLEGFVSEMKVVIEFPPGTKNMELIPAPGPNVSISYDYQALRPSAQMVYTNVEPGEYSYHVKAQMAKP